MLFRIMIGMVILAGCACGLVEDSVDIPIPGTYSSIDGREGYESRLTISKNEKAYDITLTEFITNDTAAQCLIKASGKKSSYGIWVEVPAYGPRLPIIIRKRNEGVEIVLKGPDDPKDTFTYCLTDRTPVGVYRRLSE